MTKIGHLSTTDKNSQNASSPVATVKLYPAFVRTVSGMTIRAYDRQSDGKNLSPLLRFYAIHSRFSGFKPPRSQLNRFMFHPGVMTHIMVESAHIGHFKSPNGQRKIVCLEASSAPMTYALYPYCDLQTGISAAASAYHKAVVNETFLLELHL